MGDKIDTSKGPGKKRYERETVEFPPVKMKELIREATPEHARDTVPVVGPPTAAVSVPPGGAPSTQRPVPLNAVHPPAEVSTETGIYINMGHDKVVWVEGEKKDEPKKKKNTQIFG